MIIDYFTQTVCANPQFPDLDWYIGLAANYECIYANDNKTRELVMFTCRGEKIRAASYSQRVDDLEEDNILIWLSCGENHLVLANERNRKAYIFSALTLDFLFPFSPWSYGESITFLEKKECILLCDCRNTRLLSIENGALIEKQTFDYVNDPRKFHDVAYLYPWGFYMYNEEHAYYFPYSIV